MCDASLFVSACRRENPIGQKRSRCEHDTNFKATTAFNRSLFQQIHRYISSLVSDKFDRVFSLFFQKLSLRMSGLHKVQSRHTKRQRNREQQGVMDGQSSLVQEVLDVGLSSSLTSPKESAIDYIYTACYWYANHRLAFCNWVSGCLQSA